MLATTHRTPLQLMYICMHAAARLLVPPALLYPSCIVGSFMGWLHVI